MSLLWIFHLSTSEVIKSLFNILSLRDGCPVNSGCRKFTGVNFYKVRKEFPPFCFFVFLLCAFGNIDRRGIRSIVCRSKWFVIIWRIINWRLFAAQYRRFRDFSPLKSLYLTNVKKLVKRVAPTPPCLQVHDGQF